MSSASIPPPPPWAASPSTSCGVSSAGECPGRDELYLLTKTFSFKIFCELAHTQLSSSTHSSLLLHTAPYFNSSQLVGFKSPARYTHKYLHFNVIWNITIQSSSLYSHIQRHWSQQLAGVRGNSRCKYLIKKMSMKQRLLSSSCSPLCACPSSSAYSTSSVGDVCSTLLCPYKCMHINMLWNHVTSHQMSLSRSEVHQDTRNSRHLRFAQHRKNRCPLKL